MTYRLPPVTALYSSLDISRYCRSQGNRSAIDEMHYLGYDTLVNGGWFSNDESYRRLDNPIRVELIPASPMRKGKAGHWLLQANEFSFLIDLPGRYEACFHLCLRTGMPDMLYVTAEPDGGDEYCMYRFNLKTGEMDSATFPRDLNSFYRADTEDRPMVIASFLPYGRQLEITRRSRIRLAREAWARYTKAHRHDYIANAGSHFRIANSNCRHWTGATNDETLIGEPHGNVPLVNGARGGDRLSFMVEVSNDDDFSDPDSVADVKGPDRIGPMLMLHFDRDSLGFQSAEFRHIHAPSRTVVSLDVSREPTVRALYESAGRMRGAMNTCRY